MADQAITALPKKTYSGSSKIAATDYILGIDSAEGYQMLIQDLGEYIINRVTTSLAGSNKTLAAAISALNSNRNVVPNSAVEIPNNTTTFDVFDTIIESLDSFQGKVFEIQVGSGVVLDGVSIGSGRKLCQIIRHSATNHAAIIIFGWYNQQDRYYLVKSAGNWSCTSLPSRAEVDLLNIKIQRYANNITEGNSCTFKIIYTSNAYHYGLLIGGTSDNPYFAHVFIGNSPSYSVIITPYGTAIITVTGAYNSSTGEITFTVNSGNAYGGFRYIDLS